MNCSFKKLGPGIVIRIPQLGIEAEVRVGLIFLISSINFTKLATNKNQLKFQRNYYFGNNLLRQKKIMSEYSQLRSVKKGMSYGFHPIAHKRSVLNPLLKIERAPLMLCKVLMS